MLININAHTHTYIYIICIYRNLQDLDIIFSIHIDFRSQWFVGHLDTDFGIKGWDGSPCRWYKTSSCPLFLPILEAKNSPSGDLNWKRYRKKSLGSTLQPAVVVSWLVNLPPLTYPPRNKGLIRLIKGNQWSISP